MITGLISFLGGSAFRLIWGEASAWFTAKQNHKQEIEKLRIQEAIEAAQHTRNLESLRIQSELGNKTIQIQGDVDLAKISDSAWAELVSGTTKSTGYTFIDVWNSSIRPLLATLAITVVVLQIINNGFVLSDWDKELVGAILGIYVADRSLSKRGK